jgi:hypothetical protein
MQDKAMGAGSNAAQDRHDQGIVLVHIVHNYPGSSFRLSDLIRELTEDSGDFAERDRIERAVSELQRVGLLFRSDRAVLPTRAAIRAYEVLED